MTVQSSPIKLVVGLGNPGPSYEATRHNVGAWLVERLVALEGRHFNLDTRLSAQLAALETPHPFRVMRPTTYMNESGRALRAVAHYFKLNPSEILIVHDELDLPVGTVRLKIDGGHGGHNGLRDIFSHFSDHRFVRLRIGIGHPGQKHEVSNYVLSLPSKGDLAHIQDSIETSLCHFSKIIAGDLAGVMQILHGGTHGV